MNAMPVVIPDTIAIRNPHVRRVVAEELGHDAGRSFTEAAETLILEAAELRKVSRATAKPHRREKQPAA